MKYSIVPESKIAALTYIANEMMVDQRESLIDELKQAILALNMIRCPENGTVTMRTQDGETTIHIADET